MRSTVLIITIITVVFLGSCNLSYHLDQTASLPESFIEQSTSPDTGCHQGYATDGTTHFTFDTTRVIARDTSWQITAVNDAPFAGQSGYNHLGDGDYFEGKLYVPAEHYVSCSEHGNPAVFVFDSATLAVTRMYGLQTQEVSGVTIRSEARQLWTSSFCDPTRLWVYDLDTMKLQRTVRLSPAVPNIQGLAFHGGFLYLAQHSGSIRKMYLDGVSVEVYRTDSPGAHEGIDYSQGELRWLIDGGFGEKRVHYLVSK